MARDEKSGATEVGKGGASAPSQIKSIASGAAKQKRQYFIRSQPSGPTFDTTSPNAAKLSTVPSSSEEKFRGGQD